MAENSLEAFIDEGLEQAKETLQKLEKDSILIHQVFAQNPLGRELLEKWKQQLIMMPTVQPESTHYEVGINEGIKQFVRNLILQIDKIETSGE